MITSNVKDVATSSKTHDAGEVNEKEKEKKEILAKLQEEMYALTKRLDDLRIEQFASSRALKKQKLAANFNDIEQLQRVQNRMIKEINEIGNYIKYISKLCFNYSVEFSEEEIIINLAEDSDVDPATKAVQDQCLSLVGDFQICVKIHVRDDEIIDNIRKHLKELDAKSPNVEMLTREEHQDQEQDKSFGLDQLYREE